MPEPKQELPEDPRHPRNTADTERPRMPRLDTERRESTGMPSRSARSVPTSNPSLEENLAVRLRERSVIKNGRINVTSASDGRYLTFEDLVRDMHENPCDRDIMKGLAPCHSHGIAPIMMNRERILTLAVNSLNVAHSSPQSSDEIARYLQEYIIPRIGSFFKLQPQNLTLLVVSPDEYARVRPLAESSDERIRALKDIAPDASATRTFYSVVRIAIEEGASDIHIEPYKGEFRVRFRVDGVLRTRFRVKHEVGIPLTAIIKNKARMQLEEKRLPQDGRIFPDESDVQTESILAGWSMRVSTAPAQGGEKTVLRLLQNINQDELDLRKLDLPATLVTRLQEILSFPQGLILVTGPTGSGKTTTLYSALRELNTDDVNISTAEDPVEVRLDGINQVQVHEKIDLRFPDILRSFLRQDPDIILIGEIRDEETARIAVQAALTGHLVLATVHTNDSIATITRLETLGIDRDLIQSTLSAVLSQRLVRSLCGGCKLPYRGGEHLNAIFKEPLFDPALQLFRANSGGGKGTPSCKECNGVGFKGRRAVAELWVPGSAERELILKGCGDGPTLLKLARGRDMETMLEHGLTLIREGKTTLQEGLRGVFSLDQLIEAKDTVIKIFGRASH